MDLGSDGARILERVVGDMDVGRGRPWIAYMMFSHPLTSSRLCRHPTVLLQPMKEDPPPGTKCRDKFLVQSAIITPDRETRPLQELVRNHHHAHRGNQFLTLPRFHQWTLVEKEERESIHEQKIRCSYLPPVDAPEQEGANGIAAAAVPTTATPLQNSKVESDAGVRPLFFFPCEVLRQQHLNC